ncbi:hypothetical protein A7J71_11360 [Achromobacter insolitus]|uniref:tail fiber domain-containing protein n=1 Tax=Achromobacter insolitus TaxID=217204 RepID=UPI0007C82360|nr:tail fiber domain-containing protein [Achromobacter insolitus]OAE72610.1 hypothetical protein A7J71_11360 [Achromobacter insolitus]
MTISSTTRKAGPFFGNNATIDFPFTFKVFKKQDVRVTLTDPAGADQVLLLDSSYSVTLNTNQDSNPGGTVRYPILGLPLPDSWRLTVTGGLLNTQPSDIQNSGGFYPQVVEDMSDRSTIQIQQLEEEVGRSLKFSVSDSGAGAVLPPADLRANKMLGFDSLGRPTVLVPASGSAADVLIQLAGPGGSALVGFLQAGPGSVFRPSQEKMREFLTARDKGAAGNGLADDTPHLIDLRGEALNRRSVANLGPGTFRTTASIGMVSGGTLEGDGAQSTTIRRHGSGNLINSPLEDDAVIRGLTLDMRRSVTGGDGHGVSATGQRLWADALVVKDFGSGGVGGGTGVLFEGGPSKTGGHRLTNSSFYGDPTAAVSFGWIFADTITSFANGLYSQDIVGYGHELKNDATHNNLTHLIARLCNWAVAFGQDTPGVDGADFNVTTGVVGTACDGGLITGEATYNLFSSLLFDQTGAPGREVDRSAVRLSGSSTGNAVFAAMSYGTYTQTTLLSGNRNYVQIAAHDTTPVLVRIAAGSRQNAVEIAHPGLRTSILSAIDDSSGQALDGSTANAIWCHATGQRIGSSSGTFHDRLGLSGATFLSSQKFRSEHNQYATHAYATAGAAGDIAGISYAIPGQPQQGKLLFVKGATNAADYLSIGVGGADALYVTPASIRANPDNTKSCGEATYRFTVFYGVTTTISSSDANLKKIRGPLTDAELRAWAKVQPVIYQWLDAIAEKGEDGARLHAGYIAQEVESTFTSEGLDPRRYAMFCEDEVFDTVKVKQMVSRQRFASETVRVPRIEVADGRAVQTFVDETTEIPLYEDIPLVDVDGNAVLDEKGNAVMHQVPAMHDVEEEVEVQIPAGKRLALRYDHCAVFEAAYQRRRADLIETRVAALEARP